MTNKSPLAASMAASFQKKPSLLAGGGNMLTLIIYLLLCLTSLLEVKGQTPVPPCYQIADCDMLDVVLVKQPTNVSAGPICPDSAGCADPFRQAVYKVYLRYKVPQPPMGDPLPVLDFFADYSRLNVRVKLSSFPTQNFHIAKAKTQSCFSANHAATWPAPPPNAPMGGNFAILDMVSDQIMALDLNNDEQGSLPCGQPSVNQLHFQPAAQGTNLPCPSSSLCSYAELFDVVINAYPGETITLNCEAPSQFVGFTDRDVKCSPLNCVTSLALPVVVPSTVATYTGTSNSALLVSLTGTNINPQTRNCETDISLSVSGIPTTPVTVSYVEFTVEASNLNKMTVSGLLGTASDVNITNDGTKQYAHVLIELNPAVSVSPLSPLILEKITVERPLAQNAEWSTELKLINEDKSRIKTSAACTRARLSATPASCSDSGDPQCQPGLVGLGVVAITSNCAQTQLRINLSALAGRLNLRGLDLELNFDLSPGTVISGFNWGNFLTGGAPCPTWSTGCASDSSDCFDISGSTLKVCFDLPANHPLLFSGTKHMNVFFEGTGCVNGVTVTRANVALPGGTNYIVCVPEVSLNGSGLPRCAADVGGRLATEEDKGLEDATVKLDRASDCTSTCSGTCPASALSLGGNNAGKYAFCPTCLCDKYIITPLHDQNPLNGVTTHDLVFISKHILGTEMLSSPYKMIAADANKSGSITTFDIVEIRKLILGIFPTGKLPNNTSWRFVDKGFVFPFPDNPFKERVNNNLSI